MRGYKTELMFERHEEQLMPAIAKALGVRTTTLLKHPFERDGRSLLWLEAAPKGVNAPGGITELPDIFE